MGIAAYNRGSRSISSQISHELEKVSRFRVAVEPLPPITCFEHNQPSMPPLKYWSLVDDPKMVEVGDARVLHSHGVPWMVHGNSNQGA